MLSRESDAAMVRHDPSGRHLWGLLLCGAGVVLLSPDALIVRTVHTDTWTTLFWRGAFTVLGITILTAALARAERTDDPSIGRKAGGSPTWHRALAGLFFAAATIAFVTAVRRTAAANVFVIVGAGPLVAAFLGRAALKEPVPPRTWVASGAVTAGLAWIFSGSLDRGGLDGDLLALAGSVCFACYLTVVRHARPADMTPAIGVGGGIAAAAALLAGADLAPRPPDLALLALLGCVVLPVSLSLTTRAARYLQAPEVGLVTRLESLLAPLWIWLAFEEVPPPDVVAAGVLVLTAVGTHSALALRRPPRTSPASGRDPSP